MSLMKVLTLSVKNDDETNDYDNDDCSDELDVRYSRRGCKVSKIMTSPFFFNPANKT